MVVFAVFLLILLFAGWFLDPAAAIRPGCISCVDVHQLPGAVVGLFPRALSLPADIKNRTIYTIVTKPVRASEIVLGRILGFTVVGTVCWP